MATLLGCLVLSIGNAQGEVHRNISVAIALSVQEKIQRLNPREQARIKSAIAVANQFIPLYFNGSANNITDDLSVKRWRKNILPFVNKNIDKWGDMLLEKQSGIDIVIAGIPTTFVGLCPHAELMLFQIGKENITLQYRAKVIGAVQYERVHGMRGGLLIDTGDNYQEAIVVLDRNDKVDSVEEKYRGLFVTTGYLIEAYQTSIESAHLDLVGAAPDEKIRIDGDIQSFQGWIKLIRKQEAGVCKTN